MSNVREMAPMHDAAVRAARVATKEILTMHEEGLSLTPGLHMADNFMAGLSPFTCGCRTGTAVGDLSPACAELNHCRKFLNKVTVRGESAVDHLRLSQGRTARFWGKKSQN